MYVCVCAGVTEDQIKAAAEDGVSNMRELSREYGVATGCGQCHLLAKSILDEAVQMQGQSKAVASLASDPVCIGSEQAFA